ncbi:O-antigen ligase family protein [Vibrio metschnikovii]|uniref:O-antigen ligase family protein n=1 Tax=Vibrio metschnikovii TaxID=28172 RepID=UPI001C30A7A4|nr:O-antigen polymerase [Vibrio metschnikovii]
MFANIFALFIIMNIMVIGSIFESGYFCKNKKISHSINFPFVTFCTLLFYHDFIFLNLSFFLNDNNFILSSGWKEVFLFLCLFLIFFNKVFSKNKRQNVFISIIIFFIITHGLFSSIFISKDTIFSALISSKGYIFSLLMIVLCLYGYKCNFKLDRTLNVIFYLVLIPNFLFGLWQYFNVMDISDIWFSDILEDKGFELKEFNYFRNGNFRVSGFFVGSLEYAATAAIFLMAFFTIRNKRLSYFKIALTLIMLYLSQSRTFFIGIILFILMYYFLFGIKSFYKRFLFSSFSILFLFFIVLLIISLTSKDLSALSRIIQWKDAVEFIISKPLGAGYTRVGIGKDIWPDSLIIAYMYIYGVTSFLLIGTLIYLAIKSSYFYDITKNDIYKFPSLALLVFVFFMFFQSLENVSILYFLLMLVIQNIKGISHKNVQ